jgi:hypothetical protein
MSVLSGFELRSLVAAQIAAALIRDLPKQTPESAMQGVAKAAVKMAQAIEQAVLDSHSAENPTGSQPPTKRRSFFG